VEIENRTKHSIDESGLIKAAALLVGEGEFELLLVGDEEMREINREFRNIDKTTDVLSFPLEPTPMEESLGSVVINLDLAKSVALDLGHSLEDEAVLLLVHGILHLRGYDHELDSGEMRELEADYLKQLGVEVGLIERSFGIAD